MRPGPSSSARPTKSLDSSGWYSEGRYPRQREYGSIAMKCLYLVVRSLDPTGRGGERWMNRWKPALNAFAITFGERLFPNNNQR